MPPIATSAVPAASASIDKRFSAPTVPFPAAEYLKRIEKLTKRVSAAKLDALIVEGNFNRLYLTGMRASNGRLILRPGKAPQFHTDFRYMEVAADELPPGVDPAEMPRHNNVTQVDELAKKEGWKKVGYEGAGMNALRHAAYRDGVTQITEWVNFEPTILELRSIKSPAEVQRLKAAIKANDLVFAALLKEIKPGQSEWEMQVILRRLAAGMAQGEGWESIIGVGPNSSKCHHHVTDTVLGKKNVLLIDMGVKVQDYISDMTRTVFFGEPTKKLREIYGIVLEANQKAIKAIKAGAKCADIDDIARGHIAKAGYGKKFGHGLGHGIGLEVHEEPYFSKLSTATLQAGQVMTVEPGIYLPGIGGVRIEDVVLVTKNGCEVLTKTPTELKIISA